MHIACKYQETNGPKIEDWVYICDSAYTSMEILEMEGLILSCSPKGGEGNIDIPMVREVVRSMQLPLAGLAHALNELASKAGAERTRSTSAP